ncbi:MAG: anaerobic ribonucleoside-triphosphate reductase [Caldisericia bacterium]|nr:anaerobic ribonucleoside-triphosphate reductase [Caldisericia bacterium]MDD4614439.1 anaerobic ribonucleoside-triphosphate reductase [Caldisericia bacterium]
MMNLYEMQTNLDLNTTTTTLNDTLYSYVLDGFRKRDGSVVPFQMDKITNAIQMASYQVQRKNIPDVSVPDAEKVAKKVCEELNNPTSIYFVHEVDGKRIANIEDIQDLVEITLSQEGYPEVMVYYKEYRKRRETIRKQLKIRTKASQDSRDSTDALLLVESSSENIVHPWDKSRIISSLMKETSLSYTEAHSIAKAVENKAFAWQGSEIGTTLIREMVNNELEDRGYLAQLKDLAQFSVAKSTLENIMFEKSEENSNIKSNNPEAVTQTIGEYILKQYALRYVYGPDLSRAHSTGRIHIHDLGFPDRVYCSSHSIEYIKKYGLTGLVNLNSESKPAKSAQVLTGHLNTFIASMQAYYAGALGVAYINIMYAPLLNELPDDVLYQRAQELIFNGSQNAFARGGQTVFLDFNIHTGVPSYLKNVPAICAGGKYKMRLSNGEEHFLEEKLVPSHHSSGHKCMQLLYLEEVVLQEKIDDEGSIVYDPEIAKQNETKGYHICTYGDYEDVARKFAMVMLDVWEKGDKNGRIFEFPKCDFHVSEESFSDPKQTAVLERAVEVAANNGSVYFIFDRDQVTLSACCRLRTTINDNYMLVHPETMRFCGFQNVTINIPQAAYLAAMDGKKTIEGLLEKTYESMDMAIQAHLMKKDFVGQKMMQKGSPLWQIGKESNDGRPYVDLEKSTYIIGLIGVNDALHYLFGKQMHDSPDMVDKAIEIVAAMNIKIREYTEKYNLKFTLEESPAESAARRLAKTDLIYYHDHAKDIVKGSIEDDNVYYTNSVHLSADAPIGIVERIRVQGMFHGLIESGAITHAFIGEERPSKESIMILIKNTLYKTQTAQVTISPEFSYCNKCHHQMMGIQDTCDKCGSTDIDSISRIVGYFSVINNWNKSKIEELNARHAGNYGVNTTQKTNSAHLIQGIHPQGHQISASTFDTVSPIPSCDGETCRL